MNVTQLWYASLYYAKKNPSIIYNVLSQDIKYLYFKLEVIPMINQNQIISYHEPRIFCSTTRLIISQLIIWVMFVISWTRNINPLPIHYKSYGYNYRFATHIIVLRVQWQISIYGKITILNQTNILSQQILPNPRIRGLVTHKNWRKQEDIYYWNHVSGVER